MLNKNLLQRAITSIGGFEGTEVTRAFMHEYLQVQLRKPHWMDCRTWLWEACRLLTEGNLQEALGYFRKFFEYENLLLNYVNGVPVDSADYRQRRAAETAKVEAIERVCGL